MSCRAGQRLRSRGRRAASTFASSEIEDSELRCSARRGALLPGQAALEGWTTSSPLLVLGSQTWNTPDTKGRIFCNGDKQDMVFASAAGYILRQSHDVVPVRSLGLTAVHGVWQHVERSCLQPCALLGGVCCAPEAAMWHDHRSAGAVHLVLEDSGHDSFCDIVQLVAIRYARAMGYLKSFRQASWLLSAQPHACR